MAEIVFFDIETTANVGAVDLLPEPSAPSNYKDADKIAAYIAEKRQEQVSGMALDPDFGTIRSIAVKVGTGENGVDVKVVKDGVTEADVISWFWEIAKENYGNLCGYNVIGFDLPFLLRRSMELGIKPPYVFSLSKYRTENVIDLMGVLFNWSNFKGLKFVCRRYGIKNNAEGITGADVANLTDEQLIAYNASDVLMVCELYKKMQGVYF